MIYGQKERPTGELAARSDPDPAAAIMVPELTADIDQSRRADPETGEAAPEGKASGCKLEAEEPAATSGCQEQK
jgi:hypothetical protein